MYRLLSRAAVLAATALMILIFAVPCAALTWSTPANVSNSPGFWSVNAAMDFDASGKVYIAYEDWWNSAHYIYLASNQTGEWRTALVAGDARLPVMRITPDGTIHLFYKKSSRVWETARAVNGSTWSTPQAVDPGYDSGDLWPSHAAVDSNGGLYFAWLHLWDETVSPAYAVWGRYKPLGGSWGNVEVVASGGSSKWPANTQLIANGTKFYATYDYNGAKYRVRDNGVWGPEKTISSHGGAGRLAFSPTGEMAAAWAEDIGGDSWFEVFVKFSYDGGATWSAPVNVSNYYWLDRTPEITYDASGNFHLIYQRFDYDGAQPDMWYASRVSGVWQPAVNLTNSSGRTACAFQAIRAFGDDLHFVYSDNTANGVEEVFYKSTHISYPPNTGTISGTVRNANVSDNNKNGLGGAVVVASPGDYTGVADLSGKYIILGVPVGTYSVTASEEYYGSQTKSVTVNAGQTSAVDFNLTPDSTAPAPPIAFSATAGNGKVTLRWLTPSDPDFKGTKILFRTDRFPSGPTDGTVAFDVTGSVNSWGWQEHTNLSNGTTYFYSAFSYDQLYNYSAPKQYQATPSPAALANRLSHGLIDSFTGGIADGWQSYRVNDPAGALSFAADSSSTDHYISAPSQAITNLGSTSLPTSGYTSAGIRQAVGGLTAGKTYMLVGYQDIYTSDWGADGQRYVHNFGIDPLGGTDPGTPNSSGTIGAAKWFPSDISFWNNSKGSSCYYGGLHRAHSACTAQSDSISVWSGITISNAGVRDNVPPTFNTDQMYLFEFDNPVNNTGTVWNGGFETALDLQDNGDCIPVSWAPVGGSIGQTQTSECDALGARTGDRGIRIFNRRGAICQGFMQRLGTAPGTPVTAAVWAHGGSTDTEVAVGVDPTGGTDINSPNVQWSSTNSTDWTYLSKTVTAGGSSATMFLRVKSTSSASYDGYHVACFDDASAVWTPGIGSISGIVSDAGGNPIAGAAVSTSTGGYTAVSGADGTYILANVGPGTYRVTVSGSGYTSQAVDGVVVNAGQTTGLDIKLSSPGKSIVEAKALADGTPLTVSGMVVSAVFEDFFYMEKPDRSSGIRVDSQALVKPGDIVTVSGTMSTASGERCITCQTPLVTSSGSDAPKPVMMNNRSLGGAAYGLQKAAGTSGLNNTGLLVRTTGKVMGYGDGCIFIEDGSKCYSGGIKVITSSVPGIGTTVAVTGVSACEIPSGETEPVKVIRALAGAVQPAN